MPDMNRRKLLQTGLGATLALTAAAPAMAQDKPPAPNDAAAPRAWLAHGFTDAQRESIRAAFQWGIDNQFIPGGALLIVHRGETVFREGFGVADLKTGKPFSPDAPCRIASLTKSHTSTLMAMLVERGKFGWDDPIDRYLPCFAGMKVRGKGVASRMPKIHELLSHTAGFPGKKPIESGEWKIKSDCTLAQAVEDLPAQGLATEPGTVFAYTSLGYMVAGRIAEIVTGREFGALMEETLLRPIGAATATFYPSDELKARMPTGYDRTPRGLVAIDPASRMLAAAKYPNPAGSLISTLDDVGRLMLLHRNQGLVDGKRLVAAESLRRIYKPWRTAGPAGYGLGFNILKIGPDGIGVRIRHTGASGTFEQLDFQNDFLFVFLTQVMQQKTGPFRERLLKAILSVFAPNEQAAPESPDREGQ